MSIDSERAYRATIRGIIYAALLKNQIGLWNLPDDPFDIGDWTVKESENEQG